MGEFAARFMKIDGAAEEEIDYRFLRAESQNDAETEALAIAHSEYLNSNMIDIFREGQKIARIGIAL
jgi:hypothetical protein